MLRKGHLSDFSLFRDAAANLLAPLLLLDASHKTRLPVAFEPTKPQAGLSTTTQRVTTILFLLVVGILLLGAANIHALLAGFADRILRPWTWAPFHILVATFALFVLEAVLIVAVVLHIRRDRQLEMLLRDSEERMSFAAECADLGFWRWDTDQDKFWASPYCLRIFGLPPNDSVTMADMVAMVHPDDRAPVERAINEALLNHATYEVEYRACLGDAPTRWLRARGRGTLDTDGRLANLSGTVVDVTENKQMQAMVEEQQRSLAHLARVGMVGELSGALAHELNQPLTAILSNAQAAKRMIDRGPIDLSELRDVITDIIDDDARAGAVIRHLRALLKKDEARTEILDINAVVSRTLELTRSALTAQGIVIIARFADEAMPVEGDGIQLQQLLLNLVLNAAEAMAGEHDGGTLIVTTTSVNGEIAQISVCDTGPGVPEHVRAKLFDPFFSTKQNGLGLGLSICRAIAERHGGQIHAVNNPGHGATFHIALPLAKEGAS